jgi:hypothetical protein
VASLDYALLAEYAKIDPAGLTTIVGGGFDRVHGVGPGGVQQVFLAMRIVLDEHETDVPFEIKVQSPGHEYEVGVTGATSRAPDTQPFEGKVNFNAVFGLAVPIRMAGRYMTQILLAGEVVRDLPFVVEFDSA